MRTKQFEIFLNACEWYYTTILRILKCFIVLFIVAVEILKTVNDMR